MRQLLITSLLAMAGLLPAMAQRETTLLNDDWTFHLGDASSMQRDFTHGTEYFTYLTKAIGQNQGPANPQFNDSTWQHVTLPHDWVVDLPYAAEASHSHGYKQVGYKFPQNSVGWYRRHFTVAKDDEGRDISVRFDGIFRDAEVFCNGFYLGHERSGYASQTYRLNEYLNYGGDNVLTVRCNAMTEEGWYYEGAGIYRDVWLLKRDPRHHIDNVFYTYCQDGVLHLETQATDPVTHTLKDHEGKALASGTQDLVLPTPQLWSTDRPYLYTLHSAIVVDGREVDAVDTKVGLRTLDWNTTDGFLLNGQKVELKGSDLHLDHAGVGTGVPKELWAYKVKKLKAMGMNAIRLSHNPGTPAMLDVCDSLGMLVIDENRLMGANDEHLTLLKKMILRDRNHPSVFLWSIGNEEWWIESDPRGEKIARTMIDFARQLDSSRLYTYGNAGGFGLTKQVDIHGYNYIVQNDVWNRHKTYPDWVVIGTEETSGCGTRGVYATDSLRGWMKSINYAGEERSGWEKNVIQRGWQFYRDQPWAAGVFYWTGFDYRGEPNPMVWPATGSQFGILDYCGFPKDEAYYLKAAWTAEPVLHLLPHWNLKGQEGQPVEVWAYTNLDEVELFQDGRSLGRKTMEKDGHLVWATTYKPGRLTAVGYRGGKKVATERVETTDAATKLLVETSKPTLKADGQDVVVVDFTLQDRKGRFVPDACDTITVSLSGNAEILGWGNGDPSFKAQERPTQRNCRTASIPAFMGHAQVIVRSYDLGDTAEQVSVAASINGGKPTTATIGLK